MMKRPVYLLLALCMLLSFAACTNPTDEEPIGNDWHAWGLYDFVKIGERSVAVGRAFDDENRQIGYDIYADGETQGPLLGELRVADGGDSLAELDADAFLLFEDCNGDSSVDVGLPIKGGDILWYTTDAEGGFVYLTKQSAAAE